MLNAVKRFFLGPSAMKFCPYCGSEFIEWEQEAIHEGILIVRRWRGCPEYKNNSGDFSKQYYNHYAKWVTKSSKPAYDPYTGKST